MPSINKQVANLVKDNYGGDYKKLVEDLTSGQLAFRKQSQVFSWEGHGEVLDARTLIGEGLHLSAEGTVSYSIGVADGGLVVRGTFSGSASGAYYWVLFGTRTPDFKPAETTIDVPLTFRVGPPE